MTVAVGAARRRHRHSGARVRRDRVHAMPTTGCGWCCRRQSKAGQEFTFTDPLSRHPRRGPAHRQQHARRPHVLRRELAEPDPPLAADDRSPVRQGHRRVRSSRRRITTRSSSNGVLVEELDLPQRHCGARTGSSRCRSRRGSTRSGVARFSSHHAGTVDGVPMQTWVFPQDREAGHQPVRRPVAPGDAVLHHPASARTRTRSSPTCRPPASAAAPSTRARSSTARKA